VNSPFKLMEPFFAWPREEPRTEVAGSPRRGGTEPGPAKGGRRVTVALALVLLTGALVGEVGAAPELSLRPPVPMVQDWFPTAPGCSGGVGGVARGFPSRGLGGSSRFVTGGKPAGLGTTGATSCIPKPSGQASLRQAPGYAAPSSGWFGLRRALVRRLPLVIEPHWPPFLDPPLQ